MKRFTQLFRELDESGSRADKELALRRYLEEVPEEDAAWAIWLLRGNRLKLGIPSRRLKEWAAGLAGHPDWLMDACHAHVGDLAETAALLLPLKPGEGCGLGLKAVIEEVLLPLQNWDSGFQYQLFHKFWQTLDRDQALVVDFMASRSVRPGVDESLIERALSGPEETAGSRLPVRTSLLALIYAHTAAGGGESRFRRYTFAARDDEELVAVATAESGLEEEDRRELDRWISEHVVGRRGPVRTVPPELVFEIAYEGLEASPRRKCGLRMHSPRILRWRKDKAAPEIDSVEGLQSLLGS